jgi:hypothetical protein
MSRRHSSGGFAPLATTKLSAVTGGATTDSQMISLANSFQDVARNSETQSDPTLIAMMMLMMSSGRGAGNGQIRIAPPAAEPVVNLRVNVRRR